MEAKQVEEKVQQVNELFVSGKVKRSFAIAKELLADPAFASHEMFEGVKNHENMLHMNGYNQMPTPSDEKTKQSVERVDGSYAERDLLVTYSKTKDDEKFGDIINELLAGPLEAQANAYYIMAEFFLLANEQEKAMTQFYEAIKLQPNKALYWGAFAAFANREGNENPFLALRLIEEAIELDNMNPRWHYIQGNILLYLVSVTKNLSYLPALEDAWLCAENRCRPDQTPLKITLVQSKDALGQWKKQML